MTSSGSANFFIVFSELLFVVDLSKRGLSQYCTFFIVKAGKGCSCLHRQTTTMTSCLEGSISARVAGERHSALSLGLFLKNDGRKPIYVKRKVIVLAAQLKPERGRLSTDDD